MTAIPRALTLLASGSPRDLQRLLIAAILSAEDEMLEITESHLLAAEGYKLITTVAEDDRIVLIAEPKI